MMTTFLHDGELNIPTSNSDLNSLLQEIRQVTGKDWQVIERQFERRWSWRHFRKVPRPPHYELYIYVGGMGPWQMINFYRDGATSSINVCNGAELLIAFFYGILSGAAYRKEEIK